jgi:hypothetical protein
MTAFFYRPHALQIDQESNALCSTRANDCAAKFAGRL